MVSKLAWRYVEVTYRLPDEEDSQWRAVVTEAETPNAALEEVRRNVLAAHPRATEVEEFLQRTLTKERATEVSAKMAAGSWQGWFEEGST